MHATPEQRAEILSQATCSVEEAARVLGIGRSGAYKAVESGEIKTIKIGSRYLVLTAPLQKMLDQYEHSAA